MTPTYKAGIDGCGGCCGGGGWDPSAFGGSYGVHSCRGGLSGVSPTISLKHYLQHHQFRLYNNSINFLMS